MFGMFKKKVNNSCSCNSSCCNEEEVKDSRIMVLGACCKTSKESFENVKIAVKDLGIDIEVVNVGDVVKISSYGVMKTPALVIDNKVVISGRLIKIDEVKKLIKELNVN